jgi:hypothetical protein
VPFQLVLAPSSEVSHLTFTRLRVSFSDGTEIVVTHREGKSEVSLGAVSGTIEVSAPLTFANDPLVLTGTVSASDELEVLGADLTLAQEGWKLTWRLEPTPLDVWRARGTPFVPSSGRGARALRPARRLRGRGRAHHRQGHERGRARPAAEPQRAPAARRRAGR